MNLWHWYVARENELLIDCDSRTLLQIAMKRLEDTQRIREAEIPLEVERTFVAPSNNPDHFHFAVLVKNKLSPIVQMTWQLFLMDDVNRSVHNLFRVVNLYKAPSLLISPHNWLTDNRYETNSFWRSHDAVCQCDSRVHKNKDTILQCPAHIRLRG